MNINTRELNAEFRRLPANTWGAHLTDVPAGAHTRAVNYVRRMLQDGKVINAKHYMNLLRHRMGVAIQQA